MSITDTTMTDKHSTDQNNNKKITDINEDKTESYHNEATESTSNGK